MLILMKNNTMKLHSNKYQILLTVLFAFSLMKGMDQHTISSSTTHSNKINTKELQRKIALINTKHSPCELYKKNILNKILILHEIPQDTKLYETKDNRPVLSWRAQDMRDTIIYLSDALESLDELKCSKDEDIEPSIATLAEHPFLQQTNLDVPSLLLVPHEKKDRQIFMEQFHKNEFINWNSFFRACLKLHKAIPTFPLPKDFGSLVKKNIIPLRSLTRLQSSAQLSPIVTTPDTSIAKNHGVKFITSLSRKIRAKESQPTEINPAPKTVNEETSIKQITTNDADDDIESSINPLNADKAFTPTIQLIHPTTTGIISTKKKSVDIIKEFKKWYKKQKKNFHAWLVSLLPDEVQSLFFGVKKPPKPYNRPPGTSYYYKPPTIQWINRTNYP